MENLVYHARRMVKESDMTEDAKMEVLDFLNLEDILKLQEYKKLEEQGLLLKLPCKTGDKVYFVHSGVNCISESEIDSVEAKKGVIWVKTITNNYFLNTAIGKTVFLTKEEAEQKLSELS